MLRLIFLFRFVKNSINLYLCKFNCKIVLNKLKITLKRVLLIFIVLCYNCDTGNLNVIATIPNVLYEASGIETIAATEKTEHSIYQTDFNKPLAIIMGSEGKGVSKSILNLVDHKAALPLKGEINSLNVSVACGAFLYEIIRQRSL